MDRMDSCQKHSTLESGEETVPGEAPTQRGQQHAEPVVASEHLVERHALANPERPQDTTASKLASSRQRGRGYRLVVANIPWKCCADTLPR